MRSISLKCQIFLGCVLFSALMFLYARIWRDATRYGVMPLRTSLQNTFDSLRGGVSDLGRAKTAEPIFENIKNDSLTIKTLKELYYYVEDKINKGFTQLPKSRENDSTIAQNIESENTMEDMITQRYNEDELMNRDNSVNYTTMTNANNRFRYHAVERGEYCIIYNFTIAEDLLSKMASAHLDYEPIMLAVHSTMNFLEHIVNQANNWDDFVSYALLLRDGEETALGAAARLWRCYAPVRTKLSLHVVWHRPPLMGTCVAQLPYNVQTQLNEFGEGSETNCGNFGIEEALELVHNRSLYSELPCIMYPINLMRNVARLGGTATRLQIVADSENVFSEGFARHMRPLTTRYMRDAGAKTLIAYRRFEISKTDLPKNVNELNELLHHGKANPFHKRFFSVGHNIPCLTWWLNYSTTHDVEYIVADELNYTNAHFEPQFIMPTDAPLHYEDVPTRYFDHQFLVNELCRAGYRFRIASHVFNMHAGVKTEFSITEKLTVSLARDRKRVILKEFSRYLLEKYGANRNHCPQLKE